MTMLLRRRTDPIEQLAQRLRDAYNELRVDAYQARRAAEAHQRAANQQHDTATSLAPGDDDA